MPDLPLNIESSNGGHEGSRILRLSGPLTLANLFKFQTILRQEAAPVTIIEMSAVPYIDSAGIGALTGAYVSRQKEGQSLALVGVNERVKSAMTLTQVYQFFAVFATVAEAERVREAHTPSRTAAVRG